MASPALPTAAAYGALAEGGAPAKPAPKPAVAAPHQPTGGKPPNPDQVPWRSYLGVFKYSRRALRLVWNTNRTLALGLAIGSLIGGVMPSVIAVVGKHLLDGIVLAAKTQRAADRTAAIEWLAIELGLVIGMAVVSRLLGMMRSLLRQQLGQKINVEILEKALTLELVQFENSELYDRLTRARREASSRPLSLVSQTFELG